MERTALWQSECDFVAITRPKKHIISALLDLGAENGASSAPPALQEFFRGARQFPPGPPNFSPSMLCGSNVLQRFLKNDDTPQSGLQLKVVIFLMIGEGAMNSSKGPYPILPNRGMAPVAQVGFT